ncbi:MAG: lytic transglycosylase domain-containing protein [Kluyvera cryocrescens]|nr:lytic transglycosylase domain-containing protein [Kluyvera cryocrescens]
MIINELAYKVTLRADEFLNGKRKLKDEVRGLEGDFDRSSRNINQTLKSTSGEMTKFGSAAASSFRGAYTAAAGFLGIGAGLYGIKQLFTSTANEIVRASQQAKFFGSDVNKMFGIQRGFKQAGLNGDAFIGASGNARMALANIADPTIFGGLTGAAQNLMVLGARTGLNINNLGDPNKALSEFTRYGKGHSQENLMQVMAAAGFDPTDAAKIKSGELKSLVDSETKKSNITAQQVKEQEALVATLASLDAEFDRLKQDIAMAFAPEVMDAIKSFGNWMREHHGDIIGFFRDAGDKIKAFTEAVGGAENALKILAGLYVGNKVLGGAAGSAIASGASGTATAATGALLRFFPWAAMLYSGNAGAASTGDELKRTGATWQNMLNGDQGQVNMEGLLHGIMMTESGGNPLAYNAKSGATGAYQFMAGTAREMGLRVDSSVDERLDPGKSRAAASSYMRKLLKRYGGNVDNALRAYNWGMGNVDKWISRGSNENELPEETRNYTGKVRNYWGSQISRLNAPQGPMGSIDNSQKSDTYIDKVIVNSNPQSADALTQSVTQQAKRSSTNATFSSSVK